MKKIEEDKIYYSMLECFKEFCDLSIMYGLPLLTDKYNDEKKARGIISAVQLIGKERMQGQKRRALDGVKKIDNVKELEIFLKGCYKELDIQLKRQLNRLLTDIDEKEVFEQMNKIIEKEMKSIIKELKEKENG
jgi:hypothetical protein